MLKSMQGQFDNEAMENLNKFSSSTGFRDIPPKHRSKFLERSPAQRSTGFGRWTRATDFGKNIRSSGSPSPNGNEDYYKTKNTMPSCQTTLKMLHMNCEDFEKKLSFMQNQFENLQELVNENEDHFIDLMENSERFLKDLQESGFEPKGTLDERGDPPSTDRGNAYIKEIDNIIDQYAELPNRDRANALYIPYRAFGGPKSQGRMDEFTNDFSSSKEAALFHRIRQLKNEMREKEASTSKRYESVISKLEKNVKLEAQRHNETRRNYKVLAQTANHFQNSLKDLQKAVRGHKYNVAKRSKQLNSELLKFKNKQRSGADLTTRYGETEVGIFSPVERHTFLESNSNSQRVTPSTYDKKDRPRSEVRIAPTNLNQVYYQTEPNAEEIEGLEKKLQNIKLKLQEVTKERNLLQEMCTEKDSKLRELVSQLEIEKESEKGAKEIIRNMIKLENKSTQKSMPPQPPVVVDSFQE